MGRVEEFIGSNHQGSVNCGEGSVDFVENSRGTKSLLYLRFDHGKLHNLSGGGAAYGGLSFF